MYVEHVEGLHADFNEEIMKYLVVFVCCSLIFQPWLWWKEEERAAKKPAPAKTAPAKTAPAKTAPAKTAPAKQNHCQGSPARQHL